MHLLIENLNTPQYTTRVIPRQHPLLPPKVSKLSFWSQKMSNVLRCMQKHFSNFFSFILYNRNFYFKFLELFNKKFRRNMQVRSDFVQTQSCVRFSRFYENEMFFFPKNKSGEILLKQNQEKIFSQNVLQHMKKVS